MLPFVTSHFSPADVGTFGVYRASYQLLAQLITLGAPAIVMWSHLKQPSPAAGLTGAAGKTSTILALVLVALTVPLSPWLEQIGLPGYAAAAAIATGWLLGWLLLLESILQMEGHPGKVLVLRSVEAGFFVILVLTLALGLPREEPWSSWTPLVGAQLLATGVAGLAALVMLLQRRLIAPRQAGMMTRLLGFGRRFLPHILGLWVANYIDRYLVASIVGVDAAGIYVVAYSVSMAFSSIHDGVSRTFAPALSESVLEGNEQALAKSGLFVYRYSWWGFVITLAAVFPAVLVLDFVVGAEFSSAGDLLIWLIPAQGAFGISRILTGYLISSDRAGVRSAITATTAVVNVVLSVVLIASMGVQGAALSTFITFALGAWLTQRAAIRTGLLPPLGTIGGWSALFWRGTGNA
jgi:O-antigen/teichoic acid export membrane protein